MKPAQQWRWDWEYLCNKDLGPDGDGENIVQRTSFGHFVAGAGLPLYGPRTVDERKAVAEFLHKWAEQIETD